jgi:hypothetical protein
MPDAPAQDALPLETLAQVNQPPVPGGLCCMVQSWTSGCSPPAV